MWAYNARSHFRFVCSHSIWNLNNIALYPLASAFHFCRKKKKKNNKDLFPIHKPDLVEITTSILSLLNSQDMEGNFFQINEKLKEKEKCSWLS